LSYDENDKRWHATYIDVIYMGTWRWEKSKNILQLWKKIYKSNEYWTYYNRMF